MNDDAHTLTGAYALDALDDIERARAERHLRDCPSCAAEAAELRATAARLADATVIAPPPGLRDRVLREVAGTRQLPPRTGPAPARETPAVRRWRARTAVAVAAVILAIGAAAGTWAIQEDRVRDAREQAEQLREERERVAAVLAAPDAATSTVEAADGGRMVVVSSRSLDAVVVTRVGMPVLAADRDYQLWLDIDGRMVSAGLMPGTTALVDGIAPATRVALSTEPAGGSPVPTHPVGIANLK